MEDSGCGLPFVLRCIKAGHTVRYFLPAKKPKPIGEGFPGVEIISNWVSSLKWADLVWCTGNHQFLPKLDYAKSQGVKCFTPSVKSSALEIKRAQGMKFFEDHGIEVPEYQQFNGLKEAEAHVRKTGECFVFKTLGDEEDKSLSYVGKSPADMIARLQRWQRLGLAPKGPVMLQKVIEGIEFAVSRWMGSDGFIGPYNENFEFKKLLSGNAGPNCGEAGTILKYLKGDSKIGQFVLDPLEDDLVRLGHLGDIDVNCIVDEAGKAWPLEFTCRSGWPAFNIMLATHQGDPAQWMLDACNGKDTLKVTTAIACGVVLTQPSYPFDDLPIEELTDIPIYGVTQKNQAHIAPQCVKLAKLPDMDGDEVVEREIWATSGDYLAVVTGVGKSVKQACERAYRVVQELSVPNLCYRDDVGEKLEEEVPELQKLGYAQEFTYQ